MDLTGERSIAAPREAVWSALNDPTILKSSIPGCEDLEALPDGGFTASVRIKMGPISARFTGRVTLSNLNPPISYTIEGEGAGGVAGFAKGGADVSLADAGQETLLVYTVRADVGGKIAQLGGRLINATAKNLAGQFFDRFSDQVVKTLRRDGD
jgi:carbon monoxide dehydrogenase subunit G